MTSIDVLARSASDAIHESVADIASPLDGIGAAATAAAAWTTLKYAGVGAAAAVAVVAALVIAPLDDDAATSETTLPPTTAPTTTVADDPVTTIPNTATTVPPSEPVPAPTGATTTLAPNVDPPFLVVATPGNGEHVTDKTITFSGSTEPGAMVTASGKFDAAVDGYGNWSVDLVLVDGPNGVVFVAADAAGNTTEVRMTVHRDGEDLPNETTTTIEQKAWKFIASQKYGTCSEPVPYDEFSGKGKPGDTIDVTSEHGSGSTVVDGSGSWWVKVEFPFAPVGKTFSVTVADDHGHEKSFSFVSTYSG